MIRCVRVCHWLVRHLTWIAAALAAGVLFVVMTLPLLLDWLGKVRQVSPSDLSAWLRFCDHLNSGLIDGLLAVWVFALGASFASFLNVVAYRLPRGKSILGRSQCPICQHQLSFAENFPIFGWITSLGRCRHCHVRIPPRYLLVEVTLGLIFLALYLVDVRFEFGPRQMFFSGDASEMAEALFRCGSQAILLGVLLTAVLTQLDGVPLSGGVIGVGGLLHFGWGMVLWQVGSRDVPWSMNHVLGLGYGLLLGFVWGVKSRNTSRGVWLATWGLAGWVLGAWLIPLAAGLAALARGVTERAIQQQLPPIWSNVMQLVACLFVALIVAPFVAFTMPSAPAWSALYLLLALGAVFWSDRRRPPLASVAWLCAAFAGPGLVTLPAMAQEGQTAPADELKIERQQFQAQEVMPSRFGAWIFQVATPPRLIWRDIDEVRRLGRDVHFRVRWFDANLNEFPAPQASGRWMAWLEGVAPNGTPFRRAFTFFALPEKIDTDAAPDLTVAFPNFPGPKAPPTWEEHRREFDRAGREFLTRALIDSEKGAILIAGIAEAESLGRPRRYVESTTVVNDQHHLDLKLQVLGLRDRVRPIQPPRNRSTPAPTLLAGPPAEAGVSDSAKSRIDAFCQEWASATGVPFVTLVARRGVIITHEAFGNDSQGQPIETDYRCWIASLTKTVTALMFSQFVDQGLIQLDAPLSSVFPDFPKDDPHVPTFRQCLNHTSGLAGHGDFGGMHNPHLVNIVLNAIDVVEPGKAHVYSGLGFELSAKAMEIVSGKCAARIYEDHLFRPLGFGDVVLGNASSDAELTARELATLGQWIVNRGSYGDREFVTAETMAEFMPRTLDVPGAIVEQGLGLHAVYHRNPGADSNSRRPEDLLFGPNTVGHGSFSGCILVVDPDQQLVIAQARREFTSADNDWYARFFQAIAAAIADE